MNNNENNNTQELQTMEAPQAEVSTETRRPSASPERVVSPRASVYETPELVVLELEMPGVKREQIDIRVENDELSISGERSWPVDEKFQMLHQERLPALYRRSFILSDRINVGEISATCRDGILELKLPKAVQAKPRRIEDQ